VAPPVLHPQLCSLLRSSGDLTAVVICYLVSAQLLKIANLSRAPGSSSIWFKTSFDVRCMLNLTVITCRASSALSLS
jgi:hypothetical protein